MIALLNGKLINKSTDYVVVDVGGVGYELCIPLSTFVELPECGSPVTLNVYTHLREDAIQLYGFLTQGEKDLFKTLITVSGVGPRLARNILSGINVDELVGAISSSDKALLSTIPGVGAKSAERLILELKDKVKAFIRSGTAGTPAESSTAAEPVVTDVASALENLGYKNAKAVEAVKKARAKLAETDDFEPLFKEALKILSKK